MENEPPRQQLSRPSLTTFEDRVTSVTQELVQAYAQRTTHLEAEDAELAEPFFEPPPQAAPAESFAGGGGMGGDGEEVVGRGGSRRRNKQGAADAELLADID